MVPSRPAVVWKMAEVGGYSVPIAMLAFDLQTWIMAVWQPPKKATKTNLKRKSESKCREAVLGSEEHSRFSSHSTSSLPS